jgi:murein DD-endopeptidase MepM/ murein hydrolase activator NlpD
MKRLPQLIVGSVLIATLMGLVLVRKDSPFRPLLYSDSPPGAGSVGTAGRVGASAAIPTGAEGTQGQEWPQIVHPHRFDYGPEFFDQAEGRPYFDVEQFLAARSRGMAAELAPMLDADQSLAELFDDLCSEYGVSPQVLLALIEMRTHLVGGGAERVAAHAADPLAAPESGPRGFPTQLRWAADLLSKLYLHALEGYDLYPGLESSALPQRLDAANYALYAFAEMLGYDVSQHEGRAEFATSFMETFTGLFGDPRSPLSPEQRAMLPATARPVVQAGGSPGVVPPPFGSPMGVYSAGDRLLVSYRDVEAHPYSLTNRHRGVDIVNDAIAVTAAYSGVAYRYGDCAVYIEHDTLPPLYEEYVPLRNVRTYYTHLAPDSRVEGGVRVSKGDVIGVKDVGGRCMHGDPHVHISVRPRGQGETYNALDPSPYLGAVLSYDKGARNTYPNLPAIDYLDSLVVSDPRALTFETPQEIIAWRIPILDQDAPPTGSIVADGISGRSGRISGDARREWNHGLVFRLIGFAGGMTYRVAFDIRSLREADADPPYMLVQSPSEGCAARGFDLDVGAGEIVGRSVEFTLDRCDDYYLVFGERYAGEYLVDNIAIELVTINFPRETSAGNDSGHW